jgi:hypothetical protein
MRACVRASLRLRPPPHRAASRRAAHLVATLPPDPADRRLPRRACPQLTEMEKTLAEAGVLGETIMQT